MTERKWTKFKDQTPVGLPVYVTDFKKVWIAYQSSTLGCWDNYICDETDRAWSSIELPEVPKKRLHYCEGKGGSFCSEIEELEGGKSLLFNLPPNKIATRLLSVDECPFCGFEAGK